MKAKGIGIIIAARHPSSVPAHWTPRFWNIWREKRGKQAPTAERRMVLEAKTEAALFGQCLFLRERRQDGWTGEINVQLKIAIDEVIEALKKDDENTESDKDA